jgi:nicotinate-nucleotide pyrophosphorylase
MDTGIVNDNHALLVGNIMGALQYVKENLQDIVPTEYEPIMANGGRDYTNRIRVRRPSGTYIVLVTVEQAEEFNSAVEHGVDPEQPVCNCQHTEGACERRQGHDEPGTITMTDPEGIAEELME